jgi:hypothetical protein
LGPFAFGRLNVTARATPAWGDFIARGITGFGDAESAEN